mmetsp:Transcript_120842/g.338309  ORF Transcript_120842/g.338309 Transcript_120842/m.338309 type:complete len:450 (-) Transcript_120842:37-1386(-)
MGGPVRRGRWHREVHEDRQREGPGAAVRPQRPAPRRAHLRGHEPAQVEQQLRQDEGAEFGHCLVQARLQPHGRHGEVDARQLRPHGDRRGPLCVAQWGRVLRGMVRRPPGRPLPCARCHDWRAEGQRGEGLGRLALVQADDRLQRGRGQLLDGGHGRRLSEGHTVYGMAQRAPRYGLGDPGLGVARREAGLHQRRHQGRPLGRGLRSGVEPWRALRRLGQVVLCHDQRLEGPEGDHVPHTAQAALSRLGHQDADRQQPRGIGWRQVARRIHRLLEESDQRPHAHLVRGLEDPGEDPQGGHEARDRRLLRRACRLPGGRVRPRWRVHAHRDQSHDAEAGRHRLDRVGRPRLEAGQGHAVALHAGRPASVGHEPHRARAGQRLQIGARQCEEPSAGDEAGRLAAMASADCLAAQGGRLQSCTRMASSRPERGARAPWPAGPLGISTPRAPA